MDRYPWVIPYTVCVIVTALAAGLGVLDYAFISIMLDPKIPNDEIYKIVGPAYQNTTIAFIGLVGVVGGYIAGKADGKKDHAP